MVRTSRILLLLGIVSFFSFQAKVPDKEEPAYGNITAVELKERLENGDDLVLLDVRTPEEFTGPLGHLDAAILVPVEELESRIAEIDTLKNREIIVYCRSGRRSQIASRILAKHGFRVTNLLGGMKAWNEMRAVQKNLHPRGLRTLIHPGGSKN